MRFRSKRVCSSAWLERTPDKGEVGGSSPPRPTISQTEVLSKKARSKWVWASFSKSIAFFECCLCFLELEKKAGQKRGSKFKLNKIRAPFCIYRLVILSFAKRTIHMPRDWEALSFWVVEAI